MRAHRCRSGAYSTRLDGLRHRLADRLQPGGPDGHLPGRRVVRPADLVRRVAVAAVIRRWLVYWLVQLGMLAVIGAGLLWLGARPAMAQHCEPGAFGCDHQEGHERYRVWKNGQGGSCCNGHDCRPVRARQDTLGDWHVFIPEYRRWVPVPASAMLPPDKLGDGRSHLCSSDPLDARLPTLAIYCFSPGQVRG